MPTRRFVSVLGVCACVALWSLMSATAPIDGAFSYQGRLTESGALVTGTADLRFRLYDDAGAGAQVGSEIEMLAVPVQGGLFNVELDFGIASFNGNQRWLEVDARSPAGGGYTTLSPRQPLLGTPYSIQTRGIFVDDAGNVGIGTSTPISPLHVEAIPTGSTTVILGHNTRTDTFVGYGVYGQIDGTSGSGVRGLSTNVSGGTGVTGLSEGTSGRGVLGQANANTGTTHGVRGISHSSSGRGVSGFATGSIGTNYGGYFTSWGASGRGVYGEASSGTGITYGGRFESNSTSGTGVYGVATANSGFTTGGTFYNSSTSGYGVVGTAFASGGFATGGLFQSASTSGRGVRGIAFASTGETYGGYFESESTSGRAVYGLAEANSGVTYGGWFESESTTGRGIFGFASANSGVNFAVVGHSNSSSGFDYWASGAGTNYGSPSSRRFKSNVVPIDNPLDKLAQLQGVYFDWDEEHGGHHDVGMIAEEVGAVLPEIVNYEENGVDAIGMDYSKMTPLLVEAVNALRAEKDEQINALEQRISELESLVEQLAADRSADQR